MSKNEPIDAITAAKHIHTYEVATTDGYLLHILSTEDKIRNYPQFEEIITCNDVNAEIIFLSADDEEIWQQAFDEYHSIFQ